jgi:hypothetical protein
MIAKANTISSATTKMTARPPAITRNLMLMPPIVADIAADCNERIPPGGRGSASHTVSGGRLAYAKGELRAERGAGRHVNRPPYPPYYDAIRKQAEIARPIAVSRPA